MPQMGPIMWVSMFLVIITVIHLFTMKLPLVSLKASHHRNLATLKNNSSLPWMW